MAIAIGLLKMLLELQQTRKSGALDVLGPSARVRLFVEDGSVVFADEGTVGETLGRILVRERVLTQDQYATAIERMSELRASGKRSKLGEVFVEMGLLTEEQVFAALAAQVQQKVMRALAWSSATFRFIESAGPLEIAERFATAVEPLLIAALRLADRERIDALLAQARPRYAALRGDATPGGGSTKLESIARVNAFRLPQAEDAFARSLDGSQTVAALLDAKEADGKDAGAGAGAVAEEERGAPRVDRGVVLAALLLTEALDLHRGPIAMRRMSAPRAATRPMAPKATSGKATSGKATSASALIASLDRPPPPPAPAPPPAPRVMPTPSAGKNEVSVVPAPPESAPRMPSGEKIAPLLAEKAYQAGKALVRAHRVGEALVELRRAASMYDAVEYELWAKWAEARADARGEDAHADALRATAELAIEQDTERGFATFVLGHLAKRRGDDARAKELFARARALDPEVATIDAWDVRLRMGEATPASTRGEVTALAPLLTGAKVGADADAGAKADAGAEAKAKAEAEAEAEAGAKADEHADADTDEARRIAADERLGVELEARAAQAVATQAVATPPRTVRGARGETPVERRDARLDRRGARGWIAGLGIMVVVGGGIWLATRSAPHEETTVATTATSVQTATTSQTATTATTNAAGTGAMTAAPSIASAATTVADAVADATAPASAAIGTASAASTTAADASYAETDAGLPSVDATRGVLVLPSAADSHRVYVDGRLAGVPPPPIIVPCGRRIVKIGSQGREQVVQVPCGGSVTLPYP